VIAFVVRVLTGPFCCFVLAGVILACAALVLAAGEVAIWRRRREDRDRDARMAEHIRTALETVRDDREGAGL
jgi:hypothetical protein